MTKNHKYTKEAYSLAEVLAAMLIISMALLAFSPVITKRKKQAETRSHGAWECYLGSNGAHVSNCLSSSCVKATSGEDGTKCVFKPQPSAKEYLVTVVGGGGGGASGSSATYDAISFGEPTGFIVTEPGQYDILLIGGGGGGSATRGSYGGRGGSAGVVKVLSNYSLTRGTYILFGGAGGAGGGQDGENADGSTDYNNSCTPNPFASASEKKNWKKQCSGYNGETSYILRSENSSTIASARGGYGGGKQAGMASEYSSSGQVASTDNSICASRTAAGMSGGYIRGGYATGNACNNAITLLGRNGNSSSVSIVIGKGGNGSTTYEASNGANGVAMISSGIHYGGGGGKSGGISFTSIKGDDMDSEVVVFVGKGGKGGDYENTNGYSGENSAFGYYITAKGGNGGDIRATSSTSKSGTLAGEDGGEAPLQSYGKGGKGGSSVSAKQTGASKYWYPGNEGTSGYVRVEWN